MAHTPDMPTQIKLFVMRSRARTADIQRRSMNVGIEDEHYRVMMQGWEVCLLREGPEQAQNVTQLLCLAQAHKDAFNAVAPNDAEIHQKHVTSLQADTDLQKKIHDWFVSAVFHKTFHSTQFKSVSGKIPPLLLSNNALFKRGRDEVKSMLSGELNDGSNVYEYISLGSQMEAQAKRNRETFLNYATSLWMEQLACIRAIKEVAASNPDMLLRFDQQTTAAYTERVSRPTLPNTMVEAFASLCAQKPVENIVSPPANGPKLGGP